MQLSNCQWHVKRTYMKDLIRKNNHTKNDNIVEVNIYTYNCRIWYTIVIRIPNIPTHLFIITILSTVKFIPYKNVWGQGFCALSKNKQCYCFIIQIRHPNSWLCCLKIHQCYHYLWSDTLSTNLTLSNYPTMNDFMCLLRSYALQYFCTKWFCPTLKSYINVSIEIICTFPFLQVLEHIFIR